MTDHDKEIYLYQMRYAQFLFEKHGRSALDDVEEYEIRKMETIWNAIGAEKGRSLDTLIETLWGGMGDAFEYEVKRLGDDEIEMRCTRCPFADMSRQNGMPELGFSKYCMSDYGIVKGFNAAIEFTRTKTLMEGHDCCNHHYKLRTS